MGYGIVFVLLEEFLKPLGVSQNKPYASSECASRRDWIYVTNECAVRLSQFFVTSEKFWLGLQNDYDLEEARQKVDVVEIKRFQAA